MSSLEELNLWISVYRIGYSEHGANVADQPSYEADKLYIVSQIRKLVQRERRMNER